MHKRRIGIVGATGYTGSELVRILAGHPGVEISVITSESRAGDRFSEVHPFFRGIVDNELESAENIENHDLELIFLALPHGISMDFVKKYKDKPFKIIDLSGDFRLDSPGTYKTWYQKEHSYPEGFDRAVFGLPELFRDQIKKAGLVANPGCYPTSAILGAAPLLKQKIVDASVIIIDSKSGVTGAGVKAKTGTHFPNVNDNFKAYGIKHHRHTIEIQNILQQVSGDQALVQFTPHLLPVGRGILSTLYFRPVNSIIAEDLNKIYSDFYAEEPFIRLCQNPPAIKDVRGSNYCDIFTTFDNRTGMIIVVSVIDNLVKGAAGQAVQNMNLMLGFPENEGLRMIPVSP